MSFTKWDTEKFAFVKQQAGQLTVTTDVRFSSSSKQYSQYDRFNKCTRSIKSKYLYINNNSFKKQEVLYDLFSMRRAAMLIWRHNTTHGFRVPT